MRFAGTIKSWNDDRGFGFIVPDRGGDEVFVHIKAFARRNVRPPAGQHVTFEVEVGPQGKKRAKDVRTARVGGVARVTRVDRPADWDVASLAAIPILIAVYAGAALYWTVSPLWAAAYFMGSIVTFFAYAFDKTAAVRGNWRTQEGTLLGLGLLCGWPGALLAQKGAAPQVELAILSHCVLDHCLTQSRCIRCAERSATQASDEVNGLVPRGQPGRAPAGQP